MDLDPDLEVTLCDGREASIAGCSENPDRTRTVSPKKEG